MDKNFKKGIKQLLLLDTLLSSTSTLSQVLEEAEEELEEMFGKPEKSTLRLENLLKFRTNK